LDFELRFVDDGRTSVVVLFGFVRLAFA